MEDRATDDRPDHLADWISGWMELKIFRMKIGAIIALFMIAVGVLVAAPLDRFKGANYDGYAMHSISNTNIPIYRIAGTVIAIY